MTNFIRTELFALQDLEYRDFQCKLMPTVDRDCVIGVRTPALRALSCKLKNDADINSFLCDLPHKYYEENNLHAFLIEQIPDYDRCILEFERFLPYVDNWATCDSMRPKCFAGHRAELLCKIREWLASNRTYTVRFAILMLMVHFLDDAFDKEYLLMTASVKSGEYYINMMIAWYFATALAKQWDESIAYLEKRSLPVWVHNKTIQKAVESYRITSEQKEYLRTLKIKSDRSL